MKLINLINPMHLADKLGPYYLPAIFGVGILACIIGGSCVG